MENGFIRLHNIYKHVHKNRSWFMLKIISSINIFLNPLFFLYSMDLNKKIDLAAKWIAESERLVIFTGAGISTGSGLPDFRGPDGVWTRRDKGLPPPKLKVPYDQIKPNPNHYAIVELMEMGK